MIQGKLVFDKSLSTGGSRIPVGIHEGVMFMGITKGEGFYDILFQNPAGQQIHKRLFDPNGTKTKEGESPAEAIERQTATNLAHPVEILRIAYGDDAAGSVEAPTYEAFMQKVIALTTPKKGMLVNLKVTPDRTGQYSDLGFYPSRYVEGFVEGESTKLKFSKKELETMQGAKSDTAKDEDIPF